MELKKRNLRDLPNGAVFIAENDSVCMGGCTRTEYGTYYKIRQSGIETKFERLQNYRARQEGVIEGTDFTTCTNPEVFFTGEMVDDD